MPPEKPKPKKPNSSSNSKTKPKATLTAKAHKRKLLIASLLGDPQLTRRDVAEIVGVTKGTVDRVAASVEEEISAEAAQGNDVTKRMEEYRRHIDAIMPIQTRVTRYVELAKGDHPPTALKALERLDHLCGLVTAKEAYRQQEPQTPQPMPAFILPAGTTVQVNTPPPGEPEPKRVSGAREAIHE